MDELTGLENEFESDGSSGYTFCEGNEAVESAADGTSWLWNQEGCYEATEEDLRAYFDSALNLQETFGDFDTYLAYMNDRQALIDSGEYDPGSWGDIVDTGGLTYQDPYGNYIDPDDYNNLSPNDFASKYGLDKSEVQVIEVDTTKSRQDGYNAWLESEAVQALNAEYGIDNTYRTEDGREYQWNGSGWVKVTEPDNMDFGRIMRVVTALAGSAAVGNALGPILGGALGGATGSAAGVGAVSGAISSSLGQLIINGEINPQALIQAALLGGIGGIADAAIAGDLSGSALDNAIWDLSGALGMSYEDVASILEGLATGAVTGAELQDMVLGAVGSWGQTQVMDFLQGTFGDEINVEDWFKDGQSTIPLEAIEPIVDQIIQGVINGDIDDPGAWAQTIWDYFQAGGDIDFMLPPGVNIGEWFSGSFGCPEWAKTEQGNCVWDGISGWDPELDVLECMPGWDWDAGLRQCLPIPNPCGEGLIWDADLGECLPDVDLDVDLPDIECPEGWDIDEDGVCIEPPQLCQEGYSWDILQGCIPDVDVDLPSIECPEGWDIDADGVCIEPPQLCEPGYSWDILRGCIPDSEEPEDPDKDFDLETPDLDIDLDLPSFESSYDYEMGPRAKQYAYTPFKPVEAQPVKEFEHILTNPLL